MGGGDRSEAALRWFFNQAHGGHIVVLSASYGAEMGEQFYQRVGGIQSADIIVFHNREETYDACAQMIIARADGLFIAGGDQARYVTYFKDGPVASLIDQHARQGKPLGGTSAGLAILGSVVYGALDGNSLTSDQAIADPQGPSTTLVEHFLHLSPLNDVITDSHFSERNRLGRLLAFLVKHSSANQSSASSLRGLGIDEAAAVAVETDGSARVYTEHPGASAWWINDSALKNFSAKTLNGLATRAIKLGPHSVLHLPSGEVEDPESTVWIRVSNGQVHTVTVH
jgi:beta-aspartyl-peptidase (threonine type)